jgi:VWFA-related protein
MRIARLVCCAAVAVVLLESVRSDSVHGQSQNPASQASTQAPTFRATTSLVEVDFVVYDDRGRFVPGLMPEDLELYEDGRKQAIQNFYLVTHDSSLRVSAAAAVANGTPADRAHRVFIVLFDESHLSNDSLLRSQKGAETFIQTQMGPGDVGGVFVNGQMYRGRLTTDKNELIAGVKSARPAFENRQALLAPFREFPRIPTEIDAVRIEQGAREVVDQLGEDACNRDPFLCQAEGGVNQVENLIQRKAKLYVRQARSLTARTIQNLQYVVNGLSRIPGRKTVMFVSEGFFVEESRDILEMVAGQASRAGTTIYSVDGRGLISTGANADPDVTSAAMARSTSFDTGEDAPFILTRSTGGLTIRHVDDIGRALNMIARDTSTYYVIGYQPANSTMDGTFRKIEVKANVDGLNIRARKGYLATKLPPLEHMRGGLK